MTDAAGSHRYHFNCTGTIKEIAYPNKAILSFKLNGKEERALLLSKTLSIDGKPMEDTRALSSAIKVSDVIHFDCHIYDKGGVGSGKDRCNYFAMRAWKNSPEYETARIAGGQGATNGSHPTNTKFGTGWISELHPRKGVLTFDNNGCDERVLMLASKVYFFEKRLGAKQPMTMFFSEGDPVQFEAVPQEGNADDPASSYCSWFATLVWKGKRPPVEPYAFDSPYATVTASNSVAAHQAFTYFSQSPMSRSCDSSTSSDEGDETSSYLIMPNSARLGSHAHPSVIKGVGVIAKIVTDRSGVIWWYKKPNQLQSVWFLASKTFLFGANLTGKNLTEILFEGDAVSFLAEQSPSDCPTKWVAKQVLINEETAQHLEKAKLNYSSLKEESVLS